MEIKKYIETFADLKAFVENADEIVPDDTTIEFDENTNEITVKCNN